MIWFDPLSPNAFKKFVPGIALEKRNQNGTGVIWFLTGAATVIVAMIVYDQYFRIPPPEQEH
jgi:hypothetical protein